MFVVEVKTGKKEKVRISQLKSSELLKLDSFDFEWSKESNFEVYKLSLVSNGQIMGLLSIERVIEELRIEIRLLEISTENIGKNKLYDRVAGILIAFACKESFKNGFYGFVSLIPKTKLIKHYTEKYGFQQYGRHLAIELQASELLMNRYLTYEEEK